MMMPTSSRYSVLAGSPRCARYFLLFNNKRGPVPKLTPVRSQVVGSQLATLEAGDTATTVPLCCDHPCCHHRRVTVAVVGAGGRGRSRRQGTCGRQAGALLLLLLLHVTPWRTASLLRCHLL